MKCKEFQDLIITEYVDGEISPDNLNLVNEHIDNCNTCRQFRDAVVNIAVEPFKNINKADVPEFIWERINEKIQQKNKSLLNNWFETIRNLFKFPRLAIATVSISVALLVSLIFINKPNNNSFVDSQYYVDTNLNESHEQYFSYLNNNVEENNGFGTAIEEYLLY